MSTTFETIIAVAKAVTPNVTPVEHHGDLTIHVDRDHFMDVLAELRDNPRTKFNMLVDITAVDKNTSPDRYDVVYFLLSLEFSHRVRIKVGVRDDRMELPTVVEIWESANWYERETYDMYGITFEGHPDMRRFYMPEDFMDADGTQLYPLRKDFPLMGIPGSLPLPPKEEI
ncbi:MAG: NADH-quinone oxidoreductase subunit C [Bradyrhizobiaceae bacterium]|nr:NADH-quinone oxidoreductase subunit C [Bradyrhizobiaceae bacterium]